MKQNVPFFSTLFGLVIIVNLCSFGATGDILKSFPTPGPCPTGLAFDGKYLWMADRKTDSLYQINTENGGVLKAIPAPGFRVDGLAMEGNFLWVLDLEENIIHKLNPNSGVAEKVIASPSDQSQGLAWDGRYLWTADLSRNKLVQISTEDGTTIMEIPAPARNSSGLSFDGKYFWISDRIDNMIYMVLPSNGNVILAFPSPSEYPRGLAYDGTTLWNVDYQSDSLYEIKIRDTASYIRRDAKKEKLEYTQQFRNYGPGVITSLDLYLAVPQNLPFQTILDSLTFNPQPTDLLIDRWGQKVAHYNFKKVPPKEFITVSMKVTAELYKTRFFIFPENTGSTEEIPKEIKELYLVDDTKYRITDSIISETARKVAGNETNCYWIARKIFNYLIENMHYELVGGWNVAPTVLKRGSGSCSEYSFVYIALCRAAGLPARYAGSVAIRGDDASTDDVFHRWVEVYLPNYGWIPIDPSGGDQDLPSGQAGAFGYLNNKYLITTIGGGGSEYLEWGYNSNEKWQSLGPCKVYTENIGEWSPMGKTGSETNFIDETDKTCKPK